jgi:hypothetical protein
MCYRGLVSSFICPGLPLPQRFPPFVAFVTTSFLNCTSRALSNLLGLNRPYGSFKVWPCGLGLPCWRSAWPLRGRRGRLQPIHSRPPAQAMVKLASHSWEWGTAAEALLELYTPELSVFGSNPFPNGKVPHADPSSTFALEYAKQFINLHGTILTPDSAVGDPASLGVSAILIGQSDSNYLAAATNQANYILNDA